MGQQSTAFIEDSSALYIDHQSIRFPTAMTASRTLVHIGALHIQFNRQAGKDHDPEMMKLTIGIEPVLMPRSNRPDLRVIELADHWGHIANLPLISDTGNLKVSLDMEAQDDKALEKIRLLLLTISTLRAPGAITLEGVKDKGHCRWRTIADMQKETFPVIFPKSHRRQALRMISAQLERARSLQLSCPTVS